MKKENKKNAEKNDWLLLKDEALKWIVEYALLF